LWQCTQTLLYAFGQQGRVKYFKNKLHMFLLLQVTTKWLILPFIDHLNTTSPDVTVPNYCISHHFPVLFSMTMKNKPVKGCHEHIKECRT